MENIVLLIVGLCITVIGFVNIGGNIGTIHSYNRRKVREEDIPKYGKAVGIGTVIIGIALVASFFAVTFWGETVLPCIIFPAAAVGLVFILYAQFKYNRGLF